MTYSRKVFIPLTQLCRDVCHYCTFAKAPRAARAPYLAPDEVLAIARAGAAAGCTEALFTLGDKPELRYRAAREALAALGHETTLGYLHAMAALVLRETGLLPHLNPGVMSRAEIAALREVSASQGIMLESASERLCAPGFVHHGSPDKHPAVRLETLRLAGELRVPFTTGILIGIGETRAERLEALHAIRDLHAAHGHIQEVIIQNFRAKPGTKMARAAEPDADDLVWTIAAARLILGADDEHPGAAQPLARRLSAAGRRRHQRLGRRVAGDAGPREPGSAVARDHGPVAPHRGGREAAGRAAAGLSGLCAGHRHLGRARDRDAGAADERCRGAGARRRLVARPHRPAPRARSARAHGRSGAGAASSRGPARASGSIRRDRATVRGARCRLPPRDRRRRCAAPRGERRRRALRRQPQHQLHQHLHLSLPLLRLLQGPHA